MSFKNHVNYFKRSDTPKYIGMGLMIVGFLLLWLGWGYISYILMALFIPTGIVLFLVGSSGRADDGEIDAFIKRRTEGMEVDLEEDRNYNKRILRHLPPESIENYVYRDGLLLTKAKNASLRSSEYTKAMIYTLSDSLYIPVRTISLVEDRVENRLYEIPYALLEGVELAREQKTLTFGKRSFVAKICLLTLTYDGGTVLQLPIHDDVSADRLVEKILKLAEEDKKKKEQAQL